MGYMDLLDTDAGRERLLLAGPPGSGKSFALCSLCDYISARSPNAKIFVLDADRGMAKVKRSDWPDIALTEYKLAKDWSDVDDFLKGVEPQQSSDDWVLIDMLGRFWEMAQMLEVEAVHGITPGQAMLEARRKMVDASNLNAPGSLPEPDWTVIKRFHNKEFIDKISTGWDANLIATTSLVPVDTKRDDALLVELFAPYGYRPEGEKYNAHRFDTVMFIQGDESRRNFTTVKDRGRPLLKKVKYGKVLWETYAAELEANGYTFAENLEMVPA